MARHEKGNTGRDAAGVGPYLHEGTRLASLRGLGWRVTEGDADVRGWEVRSINGRVIGTVQDLLVDEGAGEVVLLDIDLAGTRERAVAPIRAAQIDRASRVVLVDSGDVADASRFATPSRPVGPARDAEAGAEAVPTAPASAAPTVGRAQAALGEARHDDAVRDAARRTASDMTDVGGAQRVVSSEGRRGPVVVEELVVRRRVVDAADLPALESQAAADGRDVRVVGRDDGIDRLNDDLIDGKR